MSLADLQDAPSCQDVHEDVLHFISKKTILIGHNISFDISFLQRFFPGAEFAYSIDTFTRAQSLLHYQPSYALEVLVEGLLRDQQFLTLAQKW